MADDKEDAVPDPWQGIEGDDAADGADGLDFSFDALDVPEISDEDASVFAAAAEMAADPFPAAELPAESADAVRIADVPDAQPEDLTDDIAGWLADPAGSAARDIVPFDEGTAELTAAGASPVEESAAEWSAEGVDPFEVGHARDEAMDAMAIAAAGAVADGVETVVPSASGTRLVAKKSKRGGAAVGAVVGGLLSIPVVLLILLGVLWGTGRDPLNLRAYLPAFLLPSRDVAVNGVAQPIDAKPGADDVSATEADAVEPTAAEEDAGPGDPAKMVAAVAEADSSVATESPAPDGPAVAAVDPLPPPEAPRMAIEVPAVVVGETVVAAVASTPAAAVIDPFAEPAVPAPVPVPVVPEPVPLDMSGLEAAVEEALAATESIVATDDDDTADRRRALVAWYKTLARVGEELAVLETTAADAGEPLGDTPAPVLGLYERIAAAEAISADLERLCRNWVDFPKRSADGVFLIGGLEAVRQVGPYWQAAIGLRQVDDSIRQVTVISRREPRAAVGDQVGVVGVVFSGDVVWAADCGRLAAGGESDPFESTPF